MSDFLLQKTNLIRDGYEDIWWIICPHGQISKPILMMPDYDMQKMIAQYEEQKDREWPVKVARKKKQ